MDIQELKEYIESILGNTKKVFIIGHNRPDLDSLGACIGIYELMLELGINNSFIIINDDKTKLDPGVRKLLIDTARNKKQKEGRTPFIKKHTYLKNVDSSSLVIILDNNNKERICISNDLDKCGHIIIIDHHKINEKTLQSDFNYIDQSSSSTCEIVELLLNSFNYKYDSATATALLAGMYLDTRSFQAQSKITDRTNEVWYRLVHDSESKADRIYINRLLNQEFEVAKKRQLLAFNGNGKENNTEITKVVTIEKEKSMKKIKGVISVSYTRDKVNPLKIYDIEDIAKVADNMLEFSGIDISVVMGMIESNKIQISLRSSLKTINAGSIMERVGGSGDEAKAAVQIIIDTEQIENTMKGIEDKLKTIVDEEVKTAYSNSVEIHPKGVYPIYQKKIEF